MLMAYGDITRGHKLDRRGVGPGAGERPNYREWSKPRQVPGLLEEVSAARKINVIVNDGKINTLSPRTFGAATVFFAKDKPTLSSALSLYPLDCQVASWAKTSRDAVKSAPSNAPQLSWFSGSYGVDVTGVLGAAAVALLLKAKSTADLGYLYKKAKAAKLFDHGYYLVVGPSIEMADVLKKTTQISGSMPLSALGAALATRKLSDDDVRDMLDATFG